jgi:hypothetical protein
MQSKEVEVPMPWGNIKVDLNLNDYIQFEII